MTASERTHVRIVAGTAAGDPHFAKKVSALEALRPDLAALSEAVEPSEESDQLPWFPSNASVLAFKCAFRPEQAQIARDEQPIGGMSSMKQGLSAGEFCGLALLLSLPILWWPPAQAQRAETVWRIGVLMPERPGELEALVEGLRELKYVEGQNIIVEARRAARADQLPALATEIVRLQPDVIVAISGLAALALKVVTFSTSAFVNDPRTGPRRFRTRPQQFPARFPWLV